MISYHVMLMGVLMMEVVMGVIWQLQLVSKVQIYFLFYPAAPSPASWPSWPLLVSLG